MAILEGGIFSNPKGKTGGIVFGAARTRQGKKVTSRLLVPPSNPNTAAQQIQRGKFAEALAIVRLIGSTFYQGDFNRAIGQLPGFQSLTSIYLNAMDAVADIGVIPSINLGSLHKPATFDGATGASPVTIDFTWSDEVGLNGTSADVVVLLCVHLSAASTPLERDVVTDVSNTRTDGAGTVTLNVAGEGYITLMYLQGAGAADGLLSPTSYDESNSSSS